MENQHVFRLRRANAVAPHGIGAPGFVDTLVEDVVLAYPAGAIKDAGEFIGQIFAGLQVFHVQVKALVAGGVDGICQVAPTGGHRGCTQGEKFVALSQRVQVQHNLFAGNRPVVRDARWSPRISAFFDRDAAGIAVVFALFGAPVVPIIARARRHGHVGLFDARGDLGINIVPQAGQVFGLRVRIGVFRLQVSKRFFCFFITQPLVVIHEIPAMETAGDRVFFRLWRLRGCWGVRNGRTRIIHTVT